MPSGRCGSQCQIPHGKSRPHATSPPPAALNMTVAATWSTCDGCCEGPTRGLPRKRRPDVGRKVMAKCRIIAAAVGAAFGISVLGVFGLGVFAAAPAGAWERGDVDVLAVLPDTP